MKSSAGHDRAVLLAVLAQGDGTGFLLLIADDERVGRLFDLTLANLIPRLFVAVIHFYADAAVEQCACAALLRTLHGAR